MSSISIDELCGRPDEILDDLNAKEVPLVVTTGGKPVALLTALDPKRAPTPAAQRSKAGTQGWERYTRLAEGLRAGWPESQAGLTLLNDLRRPS